MKSGSYTSVPAPTCDRACCQLCCAEAPVHSIMKSGSYTAGAPTPIQRGRSAYGRSRNGRKGYVRQSTHERIEQLLQAARDTSSTVTDDEASGGEGRAARRETGPRVPTGPVWHSVHVCSAAHPVTGCPVLVVTQHDVTSQVRGARGLSIACKGGQGSQVQPSGVCLRVCMQERVQLASPSMPARPCPSCTWWPWLRVYHTTRTHAPSPRPTGACLRVPPASLLGPPPVPALLSLAPPPAPCHRWTPARSCLSCWSTSTRSSSPSSHATSSST